MQVLQTQPCSPSRPLSHLALPHPSAPLDCQPSNVVLGRANLGHRIPLCALPHQRQLALGECFGGAAPGCAHGLQRQGMKPSDAGQGFNMGREDMRGLRRITRSNKEQGNDAGKLPPGKRVAQACPAACTLPAVRSQRKAQRGCASPRPAAGGGCGRQFATRGHQVHAMPKGRASGLVHRENAESQHRLLGSYLHIVCSIRQLGAGHSGMRAAGSGREEGRAGPCTACTLGHTCSWACTAATKQANAAKPAPTC